MSSQKLVFVILRGFIEGFDKLVGYGIKVAIQAFQRKELKFVRDGFQECGVSALFIWGKQSFGVWKVGNESFVNAGNGKVGIWGVCEVLGKGLEREFWLRSQGKFDRCFDKEKKMGIAHFQASVRKNLLRDIA